MPSAKISNELVAQIENLNDTGKTTKEIAQALNLKRLQVVAILAHRQIKNQARLEHAAPEPDFSTLAAVEDPPTAVPGAGEIAEASTQEADAEDGIYVGDDAEYDDPHYWVPWNTRLSQNPHLMIIGESGLLTGASSKRGSAGREADGTDGGSPPILNTICAPVQFAPAVGVIADNVIHIGTHLAEQALLR